MGEEERAVMKFRKFNRHIFRKLLLSVVRGSKGQTLVEFSLMIPIFLFLSLALLDGGRAYFVNQVVLNAAREGARVGTMGDVPPAAVVNTITQIMESGGYDDIGWNANYSNLGTSGEPGSTTVVSLTVDFQTMTGSFVPGWTGSIPIQQTIRMRHE
jgi:Flp pilus assembly protein TadG